MENRDREFQLVQNVLNGRSEDYRVLVDRYAPMVFKIVNRFVGDEDTAEEMAQQIFVKTYERLSSFNGKSKFSTWLYMIARNHCRDYAKNIRRENKNFSEIPEPELERHMGSGDAPDKEMEKQEWQILVREGLNRINEEYAEAFLMKYETGMTYEAMSRRMDVSVSALKVRVYRAKKALKTFIEQNS